MDEPIRMYRHFVCDSNKNKISYEALLCGFGVTSNSLVSNGIKIERGDGINYNNIDNVVGAVYIINSVDGKVLGKIVRERVVDVLRDYNVINVTYCNDNIAGFKLNGIAFDKIPLYVTNNIESELTSSNSYKYVNGKKGLILNEVHIFGSDCKIQDEIYAYRIYLYGSQRVKIVKKDVLVHSFYGNSDLCINFKIVKDDSGYHISSKSGEFSKFIINAGFDDSESNSKSKEKVDNVSDASDPVYVPVALMTANNSKKYIVYADININDSSEAIRHNGSAMKISDYELKSEITLNNIKEHSKFIKCSYTDKRSNMKLDCLDDIKGSAGIFNTYVILNRFICNTHEYIRYYNVKHSRLEVSSLKLFNGIYAESLDKEFYSGNGRFIINYIEIARRVNSPILRKMEKFTVSGSINSNKLTGEKWRNKFVATYGVKMLLSQAFKSTLIPEIQAVKLDAHGIVNKDYLKITDCEDNSFLYVNSRLLDVFEKMSYKDVYEISWLLGVGNKFASLNDSTLSGERARESLLHNRVVFNLSILKLKEVMCEERNIHQSGNVNISSDEMYVLMCLLTAYVTELNGIEYSSKYIKYVHYMSDIYRHNERYYRFAFKNIDLDCMLDKIRSRVHIKEHEQCKNTDVLNLNKCVDNFRLNCVRSIGGESVVNDESDINEILNTLHLSTETESRKLIDKVTNRMYTETYLCKYVNKLIEYYTGEKYRDQKRVIKVELAYLYNFTCDTDLAVALCMNSISSCIIKLIERPHRYGQYQLFNSVVFGFEVLHLITVNSNKKIVDAFCSLVNGLDVSGLDVLSGLDVNKCVMSDELKQQVLNNKYIMTYILTGFCLTLMGRGEEEHVFSNKSISASDEARGLREYNENISIINNIIQESSNVTGEKVDYMKQMVLLSTFLNLMYL